jgi:DNA topoisomerase-3
MSKTLIIAEKPSVANDIAKTLGGFTKHDEYFESDEYVLSSAVGHLLEIAVPEEYDVKRGKWSFAHLPMIPPHFALNPIAKTESRLKVLSKLIKRKDVTTLINACDAGREGELIFRLIAQYTKAKQPVKRLWLQSMTPVPSATALPICAMTKKCCRWPTPHAAARSRLADRHQRHPRHDRLQLQGRRLLPHHRGPRADADPVDRGRARREDQEVRPARLLGSARRIRLRRRHLQGRWFDKGSRRTKPIPRSAPSACGARRLPTHRGRLRGKPGTVTEESKPTTQMSPGLFDLTSLQREANSRFGFSAKNTLGLAQALYEKHKVLTYPRTDSRHLPEDYINTVKDTWRRWRRTTTITSSPSRSSSKAGSSPTSASSTTPRSATTSPSSRPPRRPRTCPSRNRSSTTW